MEETALLLISGGLTAGVLKRMEEDNKESISKDEIGLCWAVIDWDAHPASKDGFWHLSDEHTMYGNASYLRKFKLMPIH